ncbi:uncharacterized protein A1O9_08918 [Exophiala aquamarina CBS 119918]|uniref:Oxidoreductase n=1 Tax=Exophiala aquamarina CBS 119918 TaxID=1182545 RepID=A0A072P5C2_9EURO|nr:uncharacterized protein A1O9_08918 [Exophiala aquamarina CBS 119918]KEF55264.1 hypothetical protein A1O9_08918 [Exophiala aquamarina CBS 119918]
MGRILITGSSDGLGLLSARALIKQGHSVVLHARNEQRARAARAACVDAEACLIADLTDISQTRKLADQANALGSFDAVIHNAGMYTGPYRKTNEGWPSIVAVNTISPYVLTGLLKPRPKRFVFVSSGLHNGGDSTCEDITWAKRGEAGFKDHQAYADTKLHNVLLAAALARKWPSVQTNSLDPGWVPTKMGGHSANGDIDAAIDTYVMLATGGGAAKGVTGKYWFKCKPNSPMKPAEDEAVQQKLLDELEAVTGLKLPSE